MSNIFSRTRELCRLYNIKPQRSLGQNFLINKDVYEEVIKEAELKKEDLVLEVGPGLGFLTARLAEKSQKVIAVDLDKSITDVLKIALLSQDIKNVQIVNENILDFDSADYFKEIENNYKIVANLPYGITSRFLRKFLSHPKKPGLMVLLLQKEVAERIVAKPGKMSILGASVQYYSEPEFVKVVKNDNFWPSPKVDSAIIKLKIKKFFIFKEEEEENLFFRLLKFGFSSKRKMLKNNLSNALKISSLEVEKTLIENDLDPKVRAQNLSLGDWKKLFGAFKKNML
ncbi:16S rRNA (adenine(1518)-N(6)/adenine(1519)-N(6))-dimethyltransferase RsmA [bacterium]|nr:16S rRNA (adenine(1518)-N(6)/adenine(1519)-N(6))-dimethyltransferase RsmA [bacterium]